MSLSMMIFWTSCWILFLVPPYFVWNKVYKDGLIGRASLLAISFTAATFILQAMATEHKSYDMLPQTIAFVTSFAVFLVWHLFRFHLRVMKHLQDCPPDCPQDRREQPDRRFTA